MQWESYWGSNGHPKPPSYRGFEIEAKEIRRRVVPCYGKGDPNGAWAKQFDAYDVQPSTSSKEFLLNSCERMERGDVLEKMETDACCDIMPPRQLECLLQRPGLAEIPDYARKELETSVRYGTTPKNKDKDKSPAN
jgi:hypothetical protein